MLNKFMSNLSNRERTALIITAVIISLMMLDQLILGPIVSRIKSLDAKIKEKETALKADARILASKDRVEKEARLYEEYSLAALPQEDELASLLGQIEKMAADAKIYLIDSSPSGTREEGILKAYIVKVDCEGKMEDIYSFMHNVESSRKFLKVTSLRMKPKEKDSETIAARIMIEKIVMAK